MPYKITKTQKKRPFKIVRLTDGKVVGSSKTLKKAKMSVKKRLIGAAERFYRSNR